MGAIDSLQAETAEATERPELKFDASVTRSNGGTEHS
jgi:hypothetical protein